MKDKDFDFDTSELLSSLDKLKAKYSFNFEDDDASPEVKEDSVEAVEKEPVISVEIEEAQDEEEDVTVEAAPVIESNFEDDSVVEKEAASNDMSWLIDSDEPSAEDDEPDEEPVIFPDIVEQEAVEAEPEIDEFDEPEIEKEPVTETPAGAWYLTPEVTQDEAEEEQAEADEDEPEDDEEASFVEEEEEIAAPEEEEDDEFSDLDEDDELVVIRGNAPKEEEKKEESAFFTAFMENTASDDKKVKPPKPVKSPKPAKPVKEPKEPKEKKAKKPANPKRKKLILNIVISVALVVALWACLFVTDILLVSNWSAPVFCAESESYEDGSKTYTGAFYQIQISVNEDGSVSRVSLPWFAKGPNGEK